MRTGGVAVMTFTQQDFRLRQVALNARGNNLAFVVKASTYVRPLQKSHRYEGSGCISSLSFNSLGNCGRCAANFSSDSPHSYPYTHATGIKIDTVPYPLRYSVARLKLQVDRSESDFRQDGIRSDVSHSATAHLGSMGWFPVFGWI